MGKIRTTIEKASGLTLVKGTGELTIAMECKQLRSDFNNKVAFLIPDTEERRRFAELFRACMEAQGFGFQQFFTPDAATAWLMDKR